MGIRDSITTIYATFEEGIDDTTVVGSPLLKGTLSKALNADIVDDVLIKKRNGYTAVNSAWSTRKIRAGLEYNNRNTLETLVYGESATLTGSSGIFGKLNGSGVPTTIKSNLLDDVKACMVQFSTRVFIFNGKDDFLYDGVTTRQIGIDAPSSAPTLISKIAGGLNTNGTYYYVYTRVNTVTGAESSPSPASEILVTGATASEAGFQLNIPAGDAALADVTRIYRSVSGGNILFWDDDIPIAQTTFNSIISDGYLSTELELDNSRLPEPAKFGLVNDSRVFAGGFDGNPNRIQYSKIGINGAMPESYQAGDICDCNINDGDRLVGFGLAGSNVVVLKNRSVGRLTKIEASTGGLERQGTQKYIYEEISNDISCISNDCIVSLNDVVIWLGKDDIYATDGMKIVRLGKRIRNTLKLLNYQQSHKFSAVIKTDTQQIIFSVCRSGESEPDFQIVGHYRNYPEKFAFTFYAPGENPVTHPGLPAASLFSVTLNDMNRIYAGSSKSDGFVYHIDNGGSDNGLGIFHDVRLPYDGGDNPAAPKHFHSYYLFVTSTAISPYNVLTHIWEEDTIETTVITEDTVLTVSDARWDLVTWDNFNWSSAIFEQARFYPNKKALWGRYGWRNIYANAPIVIKSIVGIKQKLAVHR